MDFAEFDFEVTDYGSIEFKHQTPDDYEVSVYVSFEGGVEPRQAIKEYWQEVADYLAWADKQEDTLKQTLVERGMLQEANEYVEDCLDFEERDGETVYLDQWEDEITLPISEEDFLENTGLESISLSFGKDGKVTSDLYFGCSPEYFGNHSIDLSLDENKQVESISIQG